MANFDYENREEIVDTSLYKSQNKICHSQKKVLWEKSFISAHALEPILGYGFHWCDDISQTCSQVW